MKAREVVASKLEEEIGDFFCDVAQLAVLAKQYLVGAYHLRTWEQNKKFPLKMQRFSIEKDEV